MSDATSRTATKRATPSQDVARIQPIYVSMNSLLSGRLFRIPEYQRAYSWQTKQRSDLFGDLRKLAEAGPNSEHFMAALVGLRRKIFESGGGNKAAIIEELHGVWREIYRTIGLKQVLNKETVRFAGTLRSKERPNRPLDEETAVAQLTGACQGSPKKVVELSRWLQPVTSTENRILSNRRWSAVTRIVQARLVAIAVLLRKFPEEEGREILRRRRLRPACLEHHERQARRRPDTQCFRRYWQGLSDIPNCKGNDEFRLLRGLDRRVALLLLPLRRMHCS
jgi:Protein of unknown function DUF262